MISHTKTHILRSARRDKRGIHTGLYIYIGTHLSLSGLPVRAIRGSSFFSEFPGPPRGIHLRRERRVVYIRIRVCVYIREEKRWVWVWSVEAGNFFDSRNARSPPTLDAGVCVCVWAGLCSCFRVRERVEQSNYRTRARARGFARGIILPSLLYDYFSTLCYYYSSSSFFC